MSENSNPIQRQRVINYMHHYGGITQFDAIEHLGILRLASRISEIKKMGYPVKSKRVTVINRFGEKMPGVPVLVGGRRCVTNARDASSKGRTCFAARGWI